MYYSASIRLFHRTLAFYSNYVLVPHSVYFSVQVIHVEVESLIKALLPTSCNRPVGIYPAFSALNLDGVSLEALIQIIVQKPIS
jgi:hypothetical protein